MKSCVIFIVCVLAFTHCQGQVPDAKAKQMNDRAINTYLKYNAYPDSIMVAIDLLNRAVAIDSLYYNAWTNKLGYECQLHKFEAAIKTAGNIARIFPKANDVLFFMGILQFKTGHDHDAVATFEKLVKIYNDAPDKKSNEDLKTDLINKAIALKLTDKTAEGNDILKKLADNEHDPAIRRYIASYLNDSKDQIINDMVPGE